MFLSSSPATLLRSALFTTTSGEVATAEYPVAARGDYSRDFIRLA